MDKDAQVHTVAKALAILEALNQSRVMPLAALHEATRLPKSSLVRLLETLIQAGYVVRVSRRDGYALTEAVLRLSSGLRHRDVVVDLARPLMEAFTRQHKWQVSLATAERDSMVVRFTTRHISPFSREQNFLNRRVHMIQSAVGRAYFSFCSEEERGYILGVLRASGDELAIQEDAGHLAAIVARTRARGYATIRRPRSNPTQSFAVPLIHPETGSPVGAVTFFYYRSAMTEAQAVERYLAPVRQLADEIVAKLARFCESAEAA
ncbi:MAG TPA: helix-turn-helix domain-containing protein [Phenylobacterium sp.]|uniref:helix-turn-helix domain-containing protein n=1 Tax=Phenylobacterium sp. TaxID=1871053 RepID=UPI002B50B512|nr:helix-turn-helix domain-containing protein [Phenylobacterium sp.]HSV01888.1 helix-turn-helix domain-containing protein [Phenylobacterium sp.]